MIDIYGVKDLVLNFDFEHIKKYKDVKMTTKILIMDFDKLKEIEEIDYDLYYIIVDKEYSQENQIYVFSKGINIYLVKDDIINKKLNMLLNNILTKDQPQDFYIDCDLNEVIIKGEHIKLTQKEIKVLTYLNDNKAKLCLREDILVKVLGYPISTDSRIVDVYIRYLRSKLKEKGNKIKTIRGKGYIFEK